MQIPSVRIRNKSHDTAGNIARYHFIFFARRSFPLLLLPTIIKLPPTFPCISITFNPARARAVIFTARVQLISTSGRQWLSVWALCEQFQFIALRAKLTGPYLLFLFSFSFRARPPCFRAGWLAPVLGASGPCLAWLLVESWCGVVVIMVCGTTEHARFVWFRRSYFLFRRQTLYCIAQIR
jgi:hypothetical protein